MYTVYKGRKSNGEWKIGCDHDYPSRAKYQNLTDYFILEEHTDIEIASDRELELQAEHGLRVDDRRYADVYRSNRSLEKRRKMSETMTGRSLSKEHKSKIGEKSKGRKTFEGKLHTNETKSKISRSQEGFRWYHDPITGKRTKRKECPPGYLPGFSL